MIEHLGWLAGTWTGNVGGETFWTQYTPADGGIVLSASKTIGPDGQATFFEFERFMMKNGVATLTPYPGGKPSVDFRIDGHDPKVKKATFVNPEHDFPRSLTYELVAADNLLIVLKGVEGGHAAEMRFDLRRAK